jgi:ADP-ribose pyrophosphatase YjhB (NUDIX family)
MALTRPFTPQEFRSIYSRVPRLSVDVLIKTPGGLVLTLREIDPYKGQWHMPGGTVLHGETLHEAVMRSAREEVGLEVEVTRPLGYIEYLSERDLGVFNQTASLVFLASVVGGELRGSSEAKNVKAWSRLPENMIIDQKRFIKNLVWLES